MTTLFLIEITEIEIDSTFTQLSIIHFQLSILYEALQCPQQFVGYTAGILCHAEILVDLHRFEVRAVGVVVMSCNRNVQSVIDVRVAFLGMQGQGFDENRWVFDELIQEKRGTTYWIHFAVRPKDNRRKILFDCR